MWKQTVFDGLAAYELATGALELTIVTGAGPRIASLRRPGGKNLLFWDAGKSLGLGGWKLMGGHRVWCARPGADEAIETYSSDNAECEVEVDGGRIAISTPVDEGNLTRRRMVVTLESDDTLEVENIIENQGPMLHSSAVWALTCTLPTPKTSYGFAIGDDNPWNCFSMVMFKEWGGHGNVKGFADPQFDFRGDLMVVEPKGWENKRMLQSHLGVMAMSCPEAEATFIKGAAYNPDGKYPLNCNAAVYIGPDNFMVEMETMGEERQIKPGRANVHTETWKLLPEAIKLESAAAIAERLWG